MDDLLSRVASLPPDKRDLLLQRFKQRKAGQSNAMQKQEGLGPFPLSFAQESIWIHDQMEPGSYAYNVPFAVRIVGPLNTGALEKTFKEIARRHESWRTVFRLGDDGPVQEIAPLLEVRIPLVDLRELPDDQREPVAERLALEEGRGPFDLARLPLFRCRLLRLADQSHLLLLTNHHIISDRWSLNLVVQDLIDLYEAFSQDRSPVIPEPHFQYKDFAVWQRRWLQGEVLERHVRYWKGQLGGVLPTLDLPTDRPRPPIQTYRGGSLTRVMPERLVDGLTALGREENATLFMALLAAFSGLLYRYSGQEDDIIVGAPIANRNKPEIESIVGFFVNVLSLRADLGGDPTFRELLTRVRRVTLDGYAHQDLPLERVVAEVQPGRDPSRSPLFQVCLTLHNIPLPSLRMGDLTLEPLNLDWGMTRFDITLYMWESEEGLAALYAYNADLFDAATIERFAAHFQMLLESAVTSPDQHVSLMPVLLESEVRQLLDAWNDFRLDVPKDLCVHQLFEAQARRTPNLPAVVFGARELTYRELNQRSNRFAHYLRKLGVGPDVIVGICLDRSEEIIVALMAAIKAGGAYLPLDPAYPKDRLSFMITDSKAKVLVTQRRLERDLHEVETQKVFIDSDWSEIADESAEDPQNYTAAQNLVYVIYTSGSTGRPKGVMVQHDSFVNLGEALREAVYEQLGPHLRVSLNAPLVFDASVKQWIQLLYGHSIHVFPEEVRLDSNELVSYVDGAAIDVLDVTPSLLRVLVSEGLTQRAWAPQVVLIGGESVDEVMWAELTASTRTKFYNMYGPTECTDDTTLFLVRIPPSRPTIGRQIANIKLHVLDRHLNLAPVGVPGELHIGGASPSRGYIGRPGATAEKFLPDPFSGLPGARMYKTGDLVRRLADGNLQFVGRLDHQVKIRGFRIELGEIESVLARHSAVRDGIVVAREDKPGDRRLVAYVVPRSSTPFDTGDLRAHLKDALPDYMIPSAFVALDTMPLTRNGKVDLKALPVPEEQPAGVVEYVAPRNEVERELAEIWAKALGLERVGVHDNFIELGGHSLRAIQILSKVRERFGISLLLPTFFLAPTVADLALVVIENRQDPTSSSILVPIQVAGTKPPLFCIHAAGGHVMIYQHLAAAMGPDQPVYGLQSRALGDPDREYESIDEMAVDYARAIRERQPTGPYHVLGWSMGGVIGASVARVLESEGNEVAFIGLIDSYLFEDDPFTVESDPLLGVSLAFGGTLVNAFTKLSESAQRSFREELVAMSPYDRLKRVMAWGQDLNVIPPDISLELLSDQVRLTERHDRLLRQHRASIIEAPLHVWWATEKNEGVLSRTDWSKFTRRGAHVEMAEGNHFTVVQPPGCHELAAHVEKHLTAARASFLETRLEVGKTELETSISGD